MKLSFSVFIVLFFLSTIRGLTIINILIEKEVSWNLSHSWSNDFLEYLNQNVDLSNVTFELLADDGTIPIDALILKKSVHFKFGSSQTCVCDSSRYNAAPILTVKYDTTVARGLEGDGVVVAHVDSKINNIKDLNGAKIGCSNLADFQTALMMKYAMLQIGMDLFKDAMMISSSTPNRTMTDDIILDLIRQGNLDVGLVSSASISDKVSIKVFQPNTFPSGLIPHGCLLAFPYVDPVLKLAVIDSLARWVPSRAVVADTGYIGWEVAHDYGVVRAVLEETGALDNSQATHSPSCRLGDPHWQYYEVATCPTGYYKVPEAKAIQNCQDLNLTCPAPACWCGICAPGPPIRVFVAAAGSAAPGNSSACLRMVSCGAARQRQGFVVTAVDGLRRAGLAVTISFGPLVPPPASSPATAALLPAASQTWNYSAAVTASAAGYSLLRIFVDGAEIDESPTVLRILPALCPEGCAPPPVPAAYACRPHCGEGQHCRGPARLTSFPTHARRQPMCNVPFRVTRKKIMESPNLLRLIS